MIAEFIFVSHGLVGMFVHGAFKKVFHPQPPAPHSGVSWIWLLYALFVVIAVVIFHFIFRKMQTWLKQFEWFNHACAILERKTSVSRSSMK